jgi:hypothetical protein
VEFDPRLTLISSVDFHNPGKEIGKIMKGRRFMELSQVQISLVVLLVTLPPPGHTTITIYL